INLGDDVAELVDEIGVVAEAAGHAVVAGAAVEAVVPGAAGEAVALRAAEQRVVAGVADERVGAGVAGQKVGAGVSGEVVGQFVAGCLQRAGAGERDVLDVVVEDRVEVDRDRGLDEVTAVARRLLHDVLGIVDDVSVVAGAADQRVGAG